jgi:hypothetical protein
MKVLDGDHTDDFQPYLLLYQQVDEAAKLAAKLQKQEAKLKAGGDDGKMPEE